MLKRTTMALLMGGLLAAAPTAYSGESGSMSDAQHRKSMGGMHHPDHAGDVDKGNAEMPTMSDAQHRKTMSGMHHPEASDDEGKNEDGAKKTPTMSDTQHHKTMGAGKHQYHERTDNPED